MSPSEEIVKGYIDSKTPLEVTKKEIVETVTANKELSSKSVTNALKSLKEMGKIKKIRRGVYQSKFSNEMNLD
jgi:predicted transcriptional regulator